MPQVTEIVLAGCDYLLNPNPRHPSNAWGHDSGGEHRAISSLFKITGIEEINGEVR
jgi:hypothetical protein